MSLASLSTLAVQRDTGAPQRTRRKPASANDAKKTEDQGYANALVAAIPSEPLALYTVIVGGIVATIDPGESERLGMRWTLYAIGLAFIVLWLGVSYLRGKRAARKRKFPLAETLAASAAFAAWGLVMPGSPLSGTLSGDDQVIWTLIITGAGVAILALLGKPLTSEAKT